MSKESRRPRRANRARPPRARDALRVSLVTYPHVTGEIRGSLARDVELAKAAVLYADHVDLVSMQANLLSQVANLRGTGATGALSFMTSLDETTLRQTGLDTDNWTPEMRALLPALDQAFDDDHFRGLLPAELQDTYEQFVPVLAEWEEHLAILDEDSGAGELRRPMSAGLLRLVELSGTDTGLAAAVQAAAGSQAGTATFDGAVGAWAERVISLLRDESQRVILDPAAIDVVQSFVNSGLLDVSGVTAERSRAAHLGAGFIGRLPAFPEAPFDELLDLRSELAGPLARYRGAVVRMSRTLAASPFERAIQADADDLWTSEVAPALVEIEDTMTDHGLVRELGRRANEDARQIVMSGSGLLIGLEQLGHLSATISAAITAAGVGAGIAGRARTARASAASDARRAEMFYLYRLGPGREDS